MEIIVRKADLVKELQLVQGIVERKNSIPILSNVLAEAAGRRAAHLPPPTSTSRCAAAARPRSRPRAPSRSGPRSSTRSRARCPMSDVHSRCCPTPGPQIECERVSFKMAGLPKEDFPALPEAQGPRAESSCREPSLRDLIARTAFAITAEDARYYLAGALLLLDKDGVAHGGHGRPSPRLRAPQGAAQGDRAAARAGAAQGHPRDRSAPGGGGSGAVPAGREPPRLHRSAAARSRRRRSRGSSRPSRRSSRPPATSRSPSSASGSPTAIRRVSLLSSERSRAVQAQRWHPASSSCWPRRPTWARRARSLAADYKGGAVEIGFNAQYLLDFLGAAGTERSPLELKDPRARACCGRRPRARPTTATSSCRCGSDVVERSLGVERVMWNG